jgi:hypothetical protein
MIKSLRRLLGLGLYIFLALPLLLGSMTMLAIRPWATDQQAYHSLITDLRLKAVLDSTELSQLVPETIQWDNQRFEGPAAVKAVQSAIPSGIFLDTANAAVDSIFMAIGAGSSSFVIDLRTLREAAMAGSETMAATYMAEATNLRTAIPPALLPPGNGSTLESSSGQALARSSLATAIRGMAEDLPMTLSPDPADISRFDRGSNNLLAIRAGYGMTSLWLSLAGAGLLIAGVFIAESDWRRRFGKLGSRIMGPGIPIMVIGLLPHLVNPTGLINMQTTRQLADFPALTEYLKFLSTRLTSGFLVVGLVAVGLGTLFLSAKHALPLKDDDLEAAR